MDLHKLNLSKNAIKVLESRYLAKNEKGECTETPEDMFLRVAKCVAEAERNYGGTDQDVEYWTEQFYNIMADGYFMPNSPTLMNAGREMGMLSACFVLPLEDSIDGIFSTVKATAMVQKAGGGTGFSFDRLRPTGDYIKSSGGYTSGPLAFWKVLSEATNAIQAGSFRRGANMGMMSITHPDIVSFIFAKQDLTKFTNFNISIKVPDTWMEAYEANPMQPHIVENFRNGRKYFIPKSVRPGEYSINELIPFENLVENANVWSMKDVMDSIVDCAWRTGEPGLIFIDEANRHNKVPNCGQFESTNPCVSGDTLLLTENGHIPIENLVGETVRIWNGEQWSSVTPELTGVNQELLLVKLSDGSEHKVTKYHRYPIMTSTNTKKPNMVRVEAQNLKIGDRLLPFEYPTIEGSITEDSTISYTRGFHAGDGHHNVEKNHDGICLYGEKIALIDKLYFRYSNNCAGRVFVMLPKDVSWDKKFVPDNTHSVSMRLSWLAGLIDSDGTVTGDGGVQITSIDRDFLMRVKRMLFYTGVGASLLHGKDAETKLMPDGRGGKKEYFCQESWRLCIPLWAVAILRDSGMETYRVDISKQATYRTNFIKVVSITPCGIADRVYCFNEPIRHMGTFDCAVLGNCGEQFLLPYESCNLGSINVAKFALTENAIQSSYLREIVRIAVRFLDNVIDVNNYPLPEIAAMSRGNRKIGLGVMGFADALFRMKISYASERGVDVGAYIMDSINDEATRYSIELSKERGVFPNFEGSVWEHPMRNSDCTTVAPTGTISIIADCSGGIEPLFSLAFIRQVLNGQKLVEVNPYFLEVAKQRGFYSDELMEKIAEQGTLANIEGIPNDIKEIFVCTHDVPPECHIAMQAAFQKYCHSSISKTINLTHDAPREDVEKSYMLAWRAKCKGITVYRDGCRSMQPMSLKKKEESPETPKVEEAPKKRTKLDYVKRKPCKTPPVLSAMRVRQTTPFGNMHINVSIDPITGQELEIFAQLGKAGDVASSDLEAIGRLSSLCLRLGCDLNDVVEQLEDIGSHMSIPTKDGRVMSLADGLAKALKRYAVAKSGGVENMLLGKEDFGKISLKEAKVEEKPAGDSTNVYKVKCPECGGVLSFTEGCIKCNSCGYSKC